MKTNRRAFEGFQGVSTAESVALGGDQFTNVSSTRENAPIPTARVPR